MHKTLIAMSGGVDSSVAALLIKKSGHECIGATMKLHSTETAAITSDDSHCPHIAAKDAGSIADLLDIPFHVFDFAEYFTENVITPFIKAYLGGLTPNPCIECNRYLKFGRLLDSAVRIGCDHIATGHYAQIKDSDGRYLLTKGLDATKDQSYVLYSLKQEQLARTLFPLGGLRKSEVRQIALEQGFINANKHESQDICFVPDGKYADFIENYSGITAEAGLIVDANGICLGEHRGLFRYTVGQRKGLGFSSATPMYIRSLHHESNTIVVGTQDELYSKSLIARDINLIPTEKLDSPLRVTAKVRYSHTEQPATVWQLDADTLRVEFDNPQRAITKGQSVVLYEADTVVGGGIISN